MAFDEAVYINYNTELHTLNHMSSIDITDVTPSIDPKIPGILLDLFPQQRIITKAFLTAEENVTVNTYLPPISLPYDSITRSDGSIGTFHSNMWVISLKVGSGKTLIVYSIIAMKRVPDRREVIVGIDGAHCSLMYHESERRLLPKDNALQVHQSMEWSCYFDEEANIFPSYKPYYLRTKTVKNVIPINLYFIAPHLYGQLTTYCAEQTTLKWRGIKNQEELAKFVVEWCRSPEDVYKDTELLIISAIRHDDSDYIDMEGILFDALADKTIDHTIISRLNSITRLLTKSRDASTYELMYMMSYIDNKDEPSYFARVFFDDYDSLPHFSTGRIPALTYAFISGTTIASGIRNWGFSKKLAYSKYARIASTMSILPKKLESIMKLSACETKDIVCTEASMKLYTIYALNGLRKIAHATANLHPDKRLNTSDIDVRIDAFIKMIYDDGTTELAGSLSDLHMSIHKYGIRLYDDKAPINVISIFTTIIQAFISYSKVVNMMAISGILLADCFKGRIRNEIASLSVIWDNYIKYGCQPKRKAEFIEFSQFIESFEQHVELVYEVLAPKDLKTTFDVLSDGLAIAIVPYIIRYVKKPSDLQRIKDKIDHRVFNHSLKIIKDLDMELAHAVVPNMKCAICLEPCTGMYFILSSCGNSVCTRCYPSAIGKTQMGLQCGLCGILYKDDDIVATPTIGQPLCTPEDAIIELTLMKNDIKDSTFCPQLTKSLLVKANTMSIQPEQFYKPTVSSGKTGEISNLLKKFLKEKGRPPRVLIYNKVDSSVLELINALDGHNIMANDTSEPAVKECETKEKSPIKCEVYDPRHIKDYKEGDIHVIIASDLARFTGLEMQYLDIIIFYSPCHDEGEYAQVVGRALRTGRDSSHTLEVYTLYYRSEQKNLEKRHKPQESINEYMRPK